jgi:hypothetical protein
MSIVENDAARECLRRGDAFARAGDIRAAVAEYIAFATWAEGEGFDLKAVAVHKQVLTLAPSGATSVGASRSATSPLAS